VIAAFDREYHSIAICNTGTISTSTNMSTSSTSIILPSNITPSAFTSKVVPLMEQKMMSPNTHFIFSSRPLLIVKYLASRKYRSCTLYLENGDRIPIDAIKMKYNIREISKQQIDISLQYDSTESIIYNMETDGAYIKSNV